MYLLIDKMGQLVKTSKATDLILESFPLSEITTLLRTKESATVQAISLMEAKVLKVVKEGHRIPSTTLISS
jgi:hypothetical protein